MSKLIIRGVIFMKIMYKFADGATTDQKTTEMIQFQFERNIENPLISRHLRTFA